MKSQAFLLFLGVAAACGQAQVAPSQHTLRDGSTEVSVRNSGSGTLTAFAVSLNDRNGVVEGPLILYGDALVDGDAGPLLPGEERRLPNSRLGRTRNGARVWASFQEPIATGGILADGTTIGDAALVARLVWRRCNMAQAVETALQILTDAGNHNFPRNQVVRQFQTMAESMNHWYLPAEQQVGRRVYQSILGKLINLPEPPLGSAFPPTTFVAEETAALNRQRVALLDSQPNLSAGR